MQKLTKSFSGFGIIEVLVVSGLGIIVGLFALDTLGVAVRTTQEGKTALEVQALSAQMSRFLSDESDCKYLLNPARLSDTTNQKGLIYKTSEGRESKDLLKTIEGFNAELIEIKGMEFLNEEDIKKIAVFYEKPFVKGKKTLDGEECDLSEPNKLKKEGCYFQTCILDYECQGNNCGGENDTCRPLSCYIGQKPEITKQQIIKKIRQLCPEPEQVLTYETVDGEKQHRCLPLLNFGSNTENPDGGRRCPAGQMIQTIKANGELVCVGLCGPNQQWSNETCECVSPFVEVGTSPHKRCDCPTVTPYYYNEQCNQCQEGTDYNTVSNECCSSTTPIFRDSTCHHCPSGQNWNGTECITCAEGTHFVQEVSKCMSCSGKNAYWSIVGNAYQCQCSDILDTKITNSSGYTCCGYWHYYNGACQPCPSWFYHNGACQHCLSQYYYNGACQPCPSRFYHNGACQHCLSQYYHDGQCRSDCREWANGRCNDSICYWSDYHNGGCQHCARDYYHNGGCQKCTRDYYHNGGCQQCIRDHYWNGACQACPRNYYHNGGCQKCTREYYHNGGCQKCKRSHYQNGRCRTCPYFYYWNGACQACHRNYYYNGACQACHRNYYHNGGCQNCPSSHYHNGGCQKCTREHYIYGACRKCSGNYYTGGTCHPCYRHFYHNGGCQNCTRDYYHNGGCQNCTRELYHNGGCQNCTRELYHNGGCQSCPEEYYHEGACQNCTSTYYHNGGCQACQVEQYRDGRCQT